MQQNRVSCVLRLECNAENGVQVWGVAQTLWLFLKRAVLPHNLVSVNLGDFSAGAQLSVCVTQTA